ncbi:hypothetical protein HYDPIDRAFT_109818 [Hydnomerulius pinastri MD-312]|nr:hypothetical protein HYDPIDRAFT_109818 [Hydnomerulius pinastri MD-312]
MVTHPILPYLPYELVEIIFRFWLMRSSRHDNGKLNATTWKRETKEIVCCCGLSKSWNNFATKILYKNIRLDSCTSIVALLRTINDRLGGFCPVNNLILVNSHHQLERTSLFQDISASLLSTCVELCSLTLASVQLIPGAISSVGSPFSNLRVLTLADGSFHSSARFLSKIPSLEALVISGIKSGCMPPASWLNSVVGESGSRDPIPPPSFHLRELSLSRAALTQAELRWLLKSSATSQSIKHLTLYDLGAHIRPVAQILGQSVETLHLGEVSSYPQTSNSKAVRVLPLFKNIKHLQISGSGWSWDEIREYTCSDLEVYALSFSHSGVRCLVRWLAQGWAPKLGQIYVEQEPGAYQPRTERDSQVVELRALLGKACTTRGIALTWFQPQNL